MEQRGHRLTKLEALHKQKAGNKTMREFGTVEIPWEAFIAALKMDGNGKYV